jgi:hypothetical protein
MFPPLLLQLLSTHPAPLTSLLLLAPPPPPPPLLPVVTAPLNPASSKQLNT